jgi:hypothetical protein
VRFGPVAIDLNNTVIRVSAETMNPWLGKKIADDSSSPNTTTWSFLHSAHPIEPTNPDRFDAGATNSSNA